MYNKIFNNCIRLVYCVELNTEWISKIQKDWLPCIATLFILWEKKQERSEGYWKRRILHFFDVFYLQAMLIYTIQILPKVYTKQIFLLVTIFFCHVAIVVSDNISIIMFEITIQIT